MPDTCAICDEHGWSACGVDHRTTRRTNAELAKQAEALDAFTVVRNWLNRHVGQVPVDGVNARDQWLTWAARNFLADPEVRVHLLSREHVAEIVRGWLREQAYAPDDIVLGLASLEPDQLTDLHLLLDRLDPDWREAFRKKPARGDA